MLLNLDLKKQNSKRDDLFLGDSLSRVNELTRSGVWQRRLVLEEARSFVEIEKMGSRRRNIVVSVSFVIVTVLVCTVAGFYASGYINIENVAMVYLLGVVLVASRCGGRAGFVTCVLSIISFDLFITEPRYQIGPMDSQLIFTYGVMFLIAFAMSLMTSKIRHLMESLESRVKERTFDLESEVLRRREAEIELKTAIDTLIQSNVTLTNFGKLASHDLQEPLRTIEGFGNLVKERYRSSLDQKGLEFLSVITNTAKSAANNIDSLLSHARLSAEGREFAYVDCNQVLEQVLASLSIALVESGAKIRQYPLPVVWGDSSLLSQVFQNLIENAIKYSGDSAPEVEINSEVTDDFYIIYFVDKGIGFDPRYRMKIFEPFVRLQDDQSCCGTGLGLSICKTIAELHGGTILAQSRQGRGTKFALSVPRKQSTDGDKRDD